MMDLSYIPTEEELTKKKAPVPSSQMVLPNDDLEARLTSCLEDWNLLWEFINGPALRKAIDVTLYAEGVKLNSQTILLLRELKQETKPSGGDTCQMVEDIRQATLQAINAELSCKLPDPWKDQHCSKCWRPREKDADVCQCGGTQFQIIKTSAPPLLRKKDGVK
jgi:hypothetical protein